VRAVRELARVVKPGGRLMMSVPYGAVQHLGWVRVMDEEQLRELIDAAAPRSHRIWVYRTAPDGWFTSDLDEAAQAGFHTYSAEAVACVRLDM
jgi:SAM-dependent methyltransferase